MHRTCRDLLHRRNFLRQWFRRVRQPVEQANQYERDEESAKRLMEVVKPLLKRTAQFIGNDNAERNLSQHKCGHKPVQGTRGYGVGRWCRTLNFDFAHWGTHPSRLM